MQLLNNSKSKP